MNATLNPAPQTAERSYKGGPKRVFQTGDLLLLSGTKFDSWVIRWATKSSYSHSGIIYVWNGPDPDGNTAEGPSTESVPRVYCLEARGAQGVRLCLLSCLLQNKHYERIVYYRGNTLTDEQRNKAIGFAFQQLGKDYDHNAIRRFALYIFMLMVGLRKRIKGEGKRDKTTEKKVAKLRNDDTWTCSELVAAAYKHAGLDITMPLDLMAPEDLVHMAGGSEELYFARDFLVMPEEK